MGVGESGRGVGEWEFGGAEWDMNVGGLKSVLGGNDASEESTVPGAQADTLHQVLYGVAQWPKFRPRNSKKGLIFSELMVVGV